MYQQNIHDPFVCFATIEVIELMIIVNCYQLPTAGTASTLPFEYFTDKLVHRASFKHLFTVCKVGLPFAIKWVGRCFHLDMPLGESRL